MSSELFVNRELSWLDFNERVLTLAEDPSVPLLERFKFVAIFSSNLDEFFQVRVGALHDRVESGITQVSFDGLSPTQQLLAIRRKTLDLMTRRDVVINVLFSQLENHQFKMVDSSELGLSERSFLNDYFLREVLPILTPLAVDPTHPFPYISNLALSIGVDITDPDADVTRFARVKVPDTIPRFVFVDRTRFVPLEQVISERLHLLFPGMNIGASGSFRVTRNTDLTIESEEAEDLLEMVELELRRRRFGNAVRLEISKDMPESMLRIILEELELDAEDVYRHEWFVGGTELWQIHRIDLPELRDTQWQTTTAGRLSAADDAGHSFFSVLRHRDLMVHHPYESFSTSTEDFIRQAAEDPKVRAIKATLYRTSADSPIARNLVRAAERGVQVVALVELTARFDEQTNVAWAKELERAGAHVVYGMVGLKTHAKCLLVVREEESGLKRYAHIGTGNYNSTTSRIYEDIGYFTDDDDITNDVSNLFNYLTGFSKAPEYAELIVAPEHLRSRMRELIARESTFGDKGRISLKMNSLVDPDIISALVDAARAGVGVDLLVRGICCLNMSHVQGLPIRVRSILGRFLEHSRIYRFAHGSESGDAAYFIGSPDMMQRNLDLRVEVLSPIHHRKHRAWLDKVLEIHWADDASAFDLSEGNCWVRSIEFSEETDPQHRLMKWATELQQVRGQVTTFDTDITTETTIEENVLRRFVPWLRSRQH
jgi:polyphosphate kinase